MRGIQWNPVPVDVDPDRVDVDCGASYEHRAEKHTETPDGTWWSCHCGAEGWSSNDTAVGAFRGEEVASLTTTEARKYGLGVEG